MIKLTKAQKKKLRQLFFLFSVTMLSAVFISFTIYGIIRITHPADQNGAEETFCFADYQAERPAVKKKLLSKNKNSRPAIPLRQVNGIVIHYTANPGTDAMANRNYFESRKNCPDKAKYKVSSHYIVGLKGDIVQCIPEDEIAYASNERNEDTISIECCHPSKDGKFTEQTYQALLSLAAYLCVKYEIPKDSIIRHYDVTGKDCPRYYVAHPDEWERLKDDVFASMKKKQSLAVLSELHR